MTLLYSIHVTGDRSAKFCEFLGILLKLKIVYTGPHVVGRGVFLGLELHGVIRVDVLALQESSYHQD
jgi:hypothetical protein